MVLYLNFIQFTRFLTDSLYLLKLQQNVNMSETIDHFIECLFYHCNQLYQVLQEIKSTINDKSVNVFDIPFMQMFTENALNSSSNHDDTIHNPVSNLNRNLPSFGLSIDPVVGDGDCAFSSIIKQLHRLPEFINKEPYFMEHLSGLGLSTSHRIPASFATSKLGGLETR